MDSSLLTTLEVAEMLRVSPMTIHRWRKSGELPVVRIGSTVRFRASDIDALIARHTKKDDS
jgi:excisionase family DNA binding protein